MTTAQVSALNAICQRELSVPVSVVGDRFLSLPPGDQSALLMVFEQVFLHRQTTIPPAPADRQSGAACVARVSPLRLVKGGAR